MARERRSFVDLYQAYFVHASIALIAITLILGLGLIVMLSGLDEVPRWWRERDAINPDDPAIVQRAERVENAITTQLTGVRNPDDPSWSVKLSDEQANAWLSVRLRETIITHMGHGAWDDRVERVLVRFEEAGILIGVRIHHRGGSSIVSARVRLRIDEHGDLWANISAIRLGETRVPSWAINLLGEGDVRIGHMRLGPGALELGDGRAARLLAVRTRDQWMDVALETVPSDR